MASSSLTSLAKDTPGLTVVTREEPGFVEAVSGRAYNARGIPSDANDPKLPDAVVTATCVEAVQAAVKFCSSNKTKIAVRSGGHSWHTSWLHGEGSIILDVGDMDTVEYDAETKSVTFGPGAKDMLEKIPNDVFYPCGHCPGVPAGGFILGGGVGLGFPKYGWTSMLVTGIQAVLASGQVVEASSAGTSEQEVALFNCLRGSYSGFPAVITSFTVKLPPAPVVLMGAFFFPISEWRRALKAVLDIQWKGDEDVSSLETTMMLGYAPPPLAEATGVSQVAMVIVNVFSDTEEEARSLYSKYSKDITGTLVPPEEPNVVQPVDVTKAIGQSYPPNARYSPQGFVADETLYESSYADIEELLEPIVDMHVNDPLPPPSHTLVGPTHPRLKVDQHKNQDLAFGFAPSLLILSFAIYQDETLDTVMEAKLKDSHEKLLSNDHFMTEMAEGHVGMTGASKCFTDTAFATVQEQIQLLDPSGAFAGFH